MHKHVKVDNENFGTVRDDVRDHSFSAYAKFFEKLTFLTPFFNKK